MHIADDEISDCQNVSVACVQMCFSDFRFFKFADFQTFIFLIYCIYIIVWVSYCLNNFRFSDFHSFMHSVILFQIVSDFSDFQTVCCVRFGICHIVLVSHLKHTHYAIAMHCARFSYCLCHFTHFAYSSMNSDMLQCTHKRKINVMDNELSSVTQWTSNCVESAGQAS